MDSTVAVSYTFIEEIVLEERILLIIFQNSVIIEKRQIILDKNH